MTISPYSKLNGYYVVTKNGKELEKGRVPVPSMEFSDILKKFELNVQQAGWSNSYRNVCGCAYLSKDKYTKLELTYLDRALDHLI